MQRRALSRTVCLVRPRQATISLGVRNLNINTNAASASPVSTLNTLIETTKDSKEGTIPQRSGAGLHVALNLESQCCHIYTQTLNVARSVSGFKTAADHVKDANIKKNFQEYAQQREQFSKELQDQVKKYVIHPTTLI